MTREISMRLLACLALPLLTFAFGCSDPVPPLAQGAFQANFQDTGVECPQKSHQGAAGVVGRDTKTTVIVDGVDNARVTCSVSGSGPFAVDATLVKGTNVLSLTIPAISATATEAMPAAGEASYQSVTTADTYNSADDTPCDFYFIGGTPESVAAGKIWVAFKCDKIVNQMSTCALGESYLLLENCTD